MNPNEKDDDCSYFSTRRTHCFNDEEGMKCEEIYTAYRQCPGRPVEELERVVTESRPQNGLRSNFDLSNPNFQLNGSGGVFGISPDAQAAEQLFNSFISPFWSPFISTMHQVTPLLHELETLSNNFGAETYNQVKHFTETPVKGHWENFCRSFFGSSAPISSVEMPIDTPMQRTRDPQVDFDLNSFKREFGKKPGTEI